MEISGGRVLPARLLSVRFARSGGPGGQKINKTSVKADLRLDLNAAALYLKEKEPARLRAALKNRLDAAGRLCVVVDEHREQARNVETALARMETLLQKALERRKKRRPTRPTKASRERRLAGKKRRGTLKKQRAEPAGES